MSDRQVDGFIDVSLQCLRLYAPDIFPMDAVGNFCLDLADCLASSGYSISLYAENFPDFLSDKIKKASHLVQDVQSDDLIIVSYSIFDPNLDVILSLSNPKLCYFHGVTPPEFLQEFEPITADLCRRSIEQFKYLGSFDFAMANSKFTSKYLTHFIPNCEIEIAPPLFPSRMLESIVSKSSADKFLGLTLLFVGRVVPHKRIEELIYVLAELRKTSSPVCLKVVGECPNASYMQFLYKLIAELEVYPESVIFTGKVSDSDLSRLYKSADAFLCMSLHEGFCIPVLEAMGFGLPVFVREGNAAAEVAGDSGVCFAGVDYTAIAQLISQTLTDHAGCSELIHRGFYRHKELLQHNSPQYWKSIIERIQRQ